MKSPAQLSLRDYFAIHADVTGYQFPAVEIAGQVLGIDAPLNDNDTAAMLNFGVKVQAAVRYRLADAMLAERAKTGGAA